MGLSPKDCIFCFVLINSVLLNLARVLILLILVCLFVKFTFKLHIYLCSRVHQNTSVPNPFTVVCRMFNVPLPFVGGNDIAHSQEFEVVEFHCKDTNTKAIGVATVGTGVGKDFGRDGGGGPSHSTVLSGYCSLIVSWEGGGGILESSLAFHSHSTVLIGCCSLIVSCQKAESVFMSYNMQKVGLYLDKSQREGRKNPQQSHTHRARRADFQNIPGWSQSLCPAAGKAR